MAAALAAGPAPGGRQGGAPGGEGGLRRDRSGSPFQPAQAAGGSSRSGRILTVDQHVAAARAIERVYWNHRTLPAGGPRPRGDYDAEVPEEITRQRVIDTLRKSEALDRLWGRPITAVQLQAEMARMAARTRRPAMLAEIFEALGGDPVLIAECLARPLLAERLIRSFYADDQRIHGAVRRRAEAARAAAVSIEQLRGRGDLYWESAWTLTGPPARERAFDATAGAPAVATSHGPEWGDPDSRLEAGALGTGDYEALGASLLSLLQAADEDERPRPVPRQGKAQDGRWPPSIPRATPGAIPAGVLGPLQEDETSFFVLSVLSEEPGWLRTARVTWLKTAFDEWWERQGPTFTARVPLSPEGSYAPVSISPLPCADDSWTSLAFDVPDPRVAHSVVWTGSEMIVWGGVNFSGDLNTGSRYDPATDIWTSTSLAGAPTPRRNATAVWTGSRMIVWGGASAASLALDSGGRYDPATDRWTPTRQGPGTPAARRAHTAVWTGSEMIIWGGRDAGGVSMNTGARYAPDTDSWVETSTSFSVPEARRGHTAVWTGAEMIVWGGRNDAGAMLNSGGQYDPSEDLWKATALGADAPAARQGHLAFWTGDRMIVWGGTADGFTFLNTGSRYTPRTGLWQPTSIGENVPSPRSSQAGVWSETEMILWLGGDNQPNAGGRYDPVADTWKTVGTTFAPSVRVQHSAIWTGSEMIVWGGLGQGQYLATGGRYAPASNTWTPTSALGAAPAARSEHTAVWTGSEMIVWGGATASGPTQSGGRYDPATDAWSPTGGAGDLPSSRRGHTAVWTGAEMIVWGGEGSFGPTNSGGRYRPSTDSWTATGLAPGVPAERSRHVAVWTGSEMIVWGGSTFASNWSNTGARYDPDTDTWRPTAADQTAPSARRSAAAVWSGRELIVWGGEGSAGVLQSGGRYAPSVDAWQPTAAGGAGLPSPRRGHSAIWTGREMIVWGGETAVGQPLDTGGRYAPIDDGWLETASGGVRPEARAIQTAVWSGAEMIVWGGRGAAALNTGGRYSPAVDGWTLTSVVDETPSARTGHTAVWTPIGMIVWGGVSGTATITGGAYCGQEPCPVEVFYRDGDGDGHGFGGDTILSCGQPPGYASVAGDCDDTDPAAFPGASDASCDGRDQNCDGTTDEGYTPQATTCGTGPCARTGEATCVGGTLQDSCVPGPPEAEICDELDNDCDGTVDNPPLPGAVEPLMIEKVATGRILLSWGSVPGATGYDLVRGSLDELAVSRGDLAVATERCLANDLAAGFIEEPTEAVPVAGAWYLIRAVNCAGAGTYDGGGSQVRSRDAGVLASGRGCP